MFLRTQGFHQVRIRDYQTMARIEVDPGDISLLTDLSLRIRVIAFLKKLGYRTITLDLEGYRSGSMDEGHKQNG
jgi:uncharacterized protein